MKSWRFVASAVLSCALLLGCAVHGSRIVLQNQMSGEVTHVKITWDGGGEQHFDIVPPSKSVSVTMSQVTTKSFSVELTRPDGTKWERQIATPFDPAYDGGVTITVEADGRVAWTEHFELRR